MSLFNVLTNVTKAAVAVAAAPVALVADVVTIPASSLDHRRGVFDRTGSMLKAAGDCLQEAVKPERKE